VADDEPRGPGSALEQLGEATAQATRRAGRGALRVTVRLYQFISADVILLLAFLGLVYCLVYFTINSNQARRVMNEFVNGRAFRGAITWGRITWGPWPSELTVEGARLADSTGQTVIHARSVDVSLNLLALLDGTIEGEHVVVRRPVVRLREVTVEDDYGRPKRELNIAAMFLPPERAPPDGQPGSGPSLRFRVDAIEDARFELDLPTIFVDARGADIVDAYFQLDPPTSGAGPPQMSMAAAGLVASDVIVKIVNGPEAPDGRPASRRPVAEVWRWHAKKVDVDQYAWRDDAFRVERLRASLGKDTVAVRGFELGLRGPGAPHLSGAVEIDTADLGPHLAMFGLRGFRGPAKLRGESTGELMSQAGTIEASGTALELPRGVRLPSWRLQTRHRDNRLDLESLEVELPDEGRVRATGFLDGEPGAFGADVTLEAVRATAIDGLPLPASTTDLLGGRVEGRIRVRGRDLFDRAAPLWGEVDLRITDPVDARVPDPLTLEAAVVAAGTRIEVPHLSVQSVSDQLVAEGLIDLETREVDAQVNAKVGALAVWWPLLRTGRALDAGTLEADARITGRLTNDPADRDALSGRGRVSARGVALSGLPALNLDLQATLRRGALEVSGLEVTAEGTRLSGDARIGLFQRDRALAGKLVVTRADLARWPHGLPLSGTADTRVTLGGTLERPQVDAQVSGQAVTWEDYPPASVDARVRWSGLANGTLRIDSALLTTPAGGARLQGELQLGERPTVNAQVDLEGLDLVSLPPLRALEVGGRLSGRVEAQGLLDAPRIAARVQIVEPRWRTLALDQVQLDGRWAGRRVEVDSLQARLEGRELLTLEQVKVELDGPRVEGRLRLDAAPLQLVNHFLGTPLPLAGTVSTTVQMKGTPSDPELTGTLDLVGAAYDRWVLGDAHFDFRAADQRVRVDGQLLGGSALSLSVPTAPGLGPATAELRFSDLALDPFLKAALPDADQEVRARTTGRIGAVWDVHADPRPSPRVEVDLSDLRANLTPVDLVNVTPVRIVYRDGGVTVRDLSLQVSGQPIRIDLVTRADGTLEGRLDGELDLAILEPVLASTFSGVQGRASVALEVRGTLDQPMPEGRVVLQSAWLVPRSPVVGAELEVSQPAELRIMGSMEPQMGPDPSEGRGRFTVFLPPTMRAVGAAPGAPETVNRLRLRRDDGFVTVRDLEIGFEQFAPSSVAVGLDASNLSLNVPDVVRATFNATKVRFGLSGLRNLNTARMFLAGEIDLQRAVYVANILSSSALNQGLRDNFSGVAQTRSVGAFERVPLLKNFAVDLTVSGENDIFVRNEIAVVALDLEVRPDVRVRGNLYDRPDLTPDERLRITGEVATLPDSSKILYAGREFDVRSGQVDFGRDSFMDATVVAQRTFQIAQDTVNTSTTSGLDSPVGASQSEITATLEFRFKLPELDGSPVFSLELSSDSNVSNIDVASLVLTGQLASQVSGQASAQPALELALSGVINRIEAPLEQTFDIDLSLIPQTTGTLFVTADKSLSRRLRLYSRTPVGENEAGLKRVFGLEYQLNNFAFGDLSNESLGLSNSTTGRLKLQLELD
jgi:hypothetical protein